MVRGFCLLSIPVAVFFLIESATGRNLFAVMGGVRFALSRGSRLTTFVQGLVGVERFSEPGFSESGLAIQTGGGADLRLWPKVFLRAQADYRFSKPPSGNFNDVRVFVGAGVAIR